MSSEELSSDSQKLVSKDVVETTARMQRKCIDAYVTVTSSLCSGMTEEIIARAVIEELQALGITNFWYNIPVMVLIGAERFMQMAHQDYDVKRPSTYVVLQRGLPVFIDIHPQHPSGFWGNFAATGIFQPEEYEAVSFLKLMQQIQSEGINALKPSMTGEHIALWFQQRFQQEQIEPVDVRGNFGHSMARGPKEDLEGRDKRLYLDESNRTPIGGRIWGIEPGGVRTHSTGNGLVVGRFEDCVYVPLEGRAVILGRREPLSVVFKGI